MALHPRKIIRDQFVKLLKGKTDAGENVVVNQIVPEWVEELPAILIYPRSESVEEYAVAPRELKRILSVSLELVAAGTDENVVSDKLDAMALQVEEIIHRDDTLGCAGVSNTILDSVDFEYDPSGEQPIGSCRLNYAVTYYQKQPRVPVDDFQGVDADWQVGHHDSSSDATIDAEDTIDLEQS